MPDRALRIGFVATRLSRTDGVSLETAKWRHVLEEQGHSCYCFAGESDWPADVTYLVPEAHFLHPEVASLTSGLFGVSVRTAAVSAAVERQKDHLKEHLHRFVGRFGIQVLVAENCLSLPMHVPLGLALTEVIAETGLPTIGHHHDFAWERTRYAINAAGDFLRAAFPPSLPTLRHVVISSFAATQLALRTSMGATLIPNVMDFAKPPPLADGYADDLRAALGLAADERLLLQPTRLVPRKRVEWALYLAAALDCKCALVVSHDAGDEGCGYQRLIERIARTLGVRLILAASRADHRRGVSASGEKVYSLADFYGQADLMTYLSSIEGFGNAFLEGVYYRRPMVVAGYDIFEVDIEPKGFRVVDAGEYVDDATIDRARELLENPEKVQEMTAHNYELGRRFFSYQVLLRRLNDIIDDMDLR